jgi:hypothetical protein
MASNSRLKSAIECVADFPDDHLEESDEIVRASGMSLSRAIADLLTESGVSASAPTLDREHDSWEFYAEWAGRRFWVLVSDMGATKLIQTEDASPILKRFFSGQAAYVAFLGLLHRELSNDARFRSVEWVA